MTINAPATGAPSNRERAKAIIGGSTGNLVEWYDWYAYAAFTLYFAPHFFPSDDKTAELLGAAAVFAVGFFMRPIGAWIMGIYADRKGRKSGLALSVSLMCAGSLLIAIAPTYESAGLIAPALLVLARLMQGLSVGGEYGASATYLSEMAGKRQRGFFSSFQYVTLIGGQLLAIGVLLVLQSALSESALDAWGWRIPFAIGAALAIVVFWIRRGLAETESFTKVKDRGAPRSGMLTLFRHHPREAFAVMMMTAGGTLAFYAFSIYMQKFLVNTSGFDRETASRINGATLFLFMIFQPVAGALSDRIGRKPLLIGFGVLGVLGTYLCNARDDARSADRVSPRPWRPDDRDGVHLDQCSGESRDVSRSHPCTWRCPALRSCQHDLWRHGRVRRTQLQGCRMGARLLLVRDSHDRDLADLLCAHERHRDHQQDHRRLILAPGKPGTPDCLAGFPKWNSQARTDRIFTRLNIELTLDQLPPTGEGLGWQKTI